MAQLSNKKNYLLTLSTGFGGMLIANLIGFISVPISLNYWQTERYGLWALITSVLVYLSVSNLGLHFAAGVLMTKNANIHKKFVIFKRSLKVICTSLSIGLIIFLGLNLLNHGWINVLGKIPVTLQVETYYACLVLGIFFFINTPFALLSSLLGAFQRSYIENTFALLSTILNFGNLLLVIYLKGNLVTFALINGCIVLALNLVKTAYFYYFVYRTMEYERFAPDLDHDSEISYRNIMVTGLRFFSIGLAAMVVWNTDNFVISHYLGLQAITPYSVTYKLYYVLFTFIFTVNVSVLPLMGKEMGNNNWEWINKTYGYFLVLMAVIGGLTWISGVLFFRDAIALWTSRKAYAGLLTVFSLGGYSYLLSMVNLNSNIINTFNYIKGAPIVAWGEASIKLGASIILIRYFGIPGVAMGTVLGALLVPAWILPFWITRRSCHRIHYDLGFVFKHFITAVLPMLVCGVFIQLYVNSVMGRFVLGAVILSFYVLISVKLMPHDVRIFIRNNMLQLMQKYLRLAPRAGIEQQK